MMSPKRAFRTIDNSNDGRIAYAAGVELYAYDIASGRIIRRYVDPWRAHFGFYLAAVVPHSDILATINADGDVIAWRAQISGVAPSPAETATYSLAPNPASDVVTITSDLLANRDARVYVVDVLGRVVKSA